MALNSRNRDKWRPGTLFGLFLIWWGAGRAVLEFFRPDQVTIGDSPITYSFLMAVALVLGGLWVIFKRNNRAPEIFSRRRRRPVKPKPRRSQ